MATIKIEIATGTNTYTRTKTISAANIGRLLAAYKALYGQIQSGTNPDGTPIMRDRTTQEVFDALAEGLVQGMTDNTVRYEKERDAKTAQDAVAAMPVT